MHVAVYDESRPRERGIARYVGRYDQSTYRDFHRYDDEGLREMRDPQRRQLNQDAYYEQIYESSQYPTSPYQRPERIYDTRTGQYYVAESRPPQETIRYSHGQPSGVYEFELPPPHYQQIASDSRSIRSRHTSRPHEPESSRYPDH